MKRKISNQFFTHYIFIFILVIVATVSAYFLLILTNQLAAGLFAKNRYPAREIIRMITIILILLGCANGSVQIVDSSTGASFGR